MMRKLDIQFVTRSSKFSLRKTWSLIVALAFALYVAWSWQKLNHQRAQQALASHAVYIPPIRDTSTPVDAKLMAQYQHLKQIILALNQTPLALLTELSKVPANETHILSIEQTASQPEVMLLVESKDNNSFYAYWQALDKSPAFKQITLVEKFIKTDPQYTVIRGRFLLTINPAHQL